MRLNIIQAQELIQLEKATDPQRNVFFERAVSKTLTLSLITNYFYCPFENAIRIRVLIQHTVQIGQMNKHDPWFLLAELICATLSLSKLKQTSNNFR